MTTTTDLEHKVQLVDGAFTPSEAWDLISALIDEKINFHKLHRLSIWERDNLSDTGFDNKRMHQLLQEKEAFKAIYREAKQNGKKVRINGVINVDFID